MSGRQTQPGKIPFYRYTPNGAQHVYLLTPESLFSKQVFAKTETMEPLKAYTCQNSDFIDRVDVICPKCHKKALVIGVSANASREEQEEQVRFACHSCGYSLKLANTPKTLFYRTSRGKSVYGRVLHLNAPIDPFFGFNVWYQIDCAHGLLWAYNAAHLSVIESYIKDKLRTRSNIFHMNRSIASRLPRWIGIAKNRDYLLKLIERAKNKV